MIRPKSLQALGSCSRNRPRRPAQLQPVAPDRNHRTHQHMSPPKTCHRHTKLDARHRLHPERAGGGGPRPPVHGSRRPGRSVHAGARAAGQAQAGGRRARGRRRLHGGWLCAGERRLRRRARDRRPGRLQHGDRGRHREDRRLAGAGDDRRGAARHGRPRRVPGREPGHARRHRRDGAAHAPVEDGRQQQEPQSLVPPCADDHVGAAARAGSSLADARRAHRRMRG